MSSDAPIFIVGCQRSGTTVLRLMLDSHPSIACGPETRFLPDLERITGADWERIARFGFPREYWLEQVAGFFGSFQAKYAAEHGKRRWADKSPLYAMSLDYIWEVFPDAQVIHIIRDVRDVTASHRKKFTYRAALGAPAKWQRYIRTVRRAAARVSPDLYHEVRYESLVTDREQVLRRIIDFLGEPWDPAMLNYESADHDVNPVYWTESASRRAGRLERQHLDPLLQLSATVFSQPLRRELGY